MTEADRRAIARDLVNLVEGEVRFDLHNRMLYATDASLYQVAPIGVVIPASIEDAERAVQFCAERGLAVLPRGGGTSLAGQCVNDAVVIDFSARCRAVGAVDPDRRTVSVEPGVTLDELNEEIARRGHRLFFGPDVATSRHANIGGMIGNNSAGARSILYGRTVEHLLAVDAAVVTRDGGVERVRLERGAALRDGRVRAMTEAVCGVVQRHAAEIRARFPKIVRHVDGYNLDLVLQQMEGSGGHARGQGDGAAARGGVEDVNLASLVCGSEGTLAVTLGATLNLVPTPAAKGLAVVGFASLDDAMSALIPILGTGPSAVELLDDMVIDLARANAEHAPAVGLLPAPAGGDVKAVLYVEFFAQERTEEIAERFEALRRTIPGAPTLTYTAPTAMERAWRLRKAGEPLLHGLPGDRKPLTFVEDTAVDPSRLAAFVKDFRAMVARYGTKAAFYAHASVGCLHIRPLLDLRDAGDRTRLVKIAVEAADLVRAYEGALSGEHGDGRVRSPLLERVLGPEVMRALREVKAIFDPRNLLNPGNIVSPPEGAAGVESIVVRTRVNPSEAPDRLTRFPRVETYFEYEDQHGFQGAVEMCNGAGVCRKKRGGTMCPSYMGTLDERHSTRGRGNALRLAISGQLCVETWSDRETIETLDLCLSCKACKSECPSNVDIARLKAEYTAQRYREQGGAPRAARLLGRVRALNAAGSMAPGIANWVSGTGPARAVMGRVLDFSPRRRPPRFERSLYRWFAGHARGRVNAGGPKVALFADCFTTYNEPRVGVAAVRLLEALGYEVVLPRTGCCGRSMISLGLLEEAIPEVDRTLRALAPLAADDSVGAIVVCEPSCLSSFKDDLLQLKVKTARDVRARLAAKMWLPEEFIEREWEGHPRRPERVEVGGGGGSGGERILLHGHCHQKALWGAEGSAGLLRRLVGERLTVLDAGCCGMAGSFGYTKGHYDLSMKIGELALFPALRGAAADAMIAATGTSCRHQIHDGVGRRAVHPIEVAASMLVEQEDQQR